MGIVTEFFQKPGHIRKMLIKASACTIFYRIRIRHESFSAIAAGMGEFRYETPSETFGDPYIDEVKWVMYAVRRWAFWDTKCFDRALTAKKLLNEKGFPCTIYMGVRKNAKGEMIAHAWVRCGTVFVSGGNGVSYAVTGIYGDRS